MFITMLQYSIQVTLRRFGNMPQLTVYLLTTQRLDQLHQVMSRQFKVYATGVDFEYNSVTGYGQYIYVHAGSTFTAFDYNQWGTTGGNGNSPWQWMSTGANTLSAWQAACSCDAHAWQQTG